MLLRCSSSKIREGCLACVENAEALAVAADHLADSFPAYAFSLIILGYQELGKVLLLLRAQEDWSKSGANSSSALSIPDFLRHERKMEAFSQLDAYLAILDETLWAELESRIEQLVGWKNKQDPLLPPLDPDEALHQTAAYKKLMSKIEKDGERIRRATLYVDFDEELNVWNRPYALKLDDDLKEGFEWCQRRLFRCALHVQHLLDPDLLDKVDNKPKMGGVIWRIKMQSRIKMITLRVGLWYSKLRSKEHGL